jgi:ABC-type enterochelin transport system permease subunit
MILAYSLVIGCSLMHIFCCGIPLFATIIGLGTTLGFVGSEILQNPLFEGFEEFEIEILFLSGLILLSAFILKLRAKQLDCCEKEAKNLCNTNEKINNLFLSISSALYLFSMLTFFIS